MTTGLDTFDASLQKTNEILSEIENKFGWQNHRHQSYAALRAVLIALRDRLTVEDAVRFGAQLPMLIRGFYYEQWDPTKAPIKMNKEQFILHVIDNFGFPISASYDEFISFVLKTLLKHLGKGEEEKLRNLLPKELTDLV